MLFSYITRQCITKLKRYSDKRNPVRPPSSRNNAEEAEGENVDSAMLLFDSITPSTTSINATMPNATRFTDDTSPVSINDRSLFGRLLSHKRCRKVIDRHKCKNVCTVTLENKISSIRYFVLFSVNIDFISEELLMDLPHDRATKIGITKEISWFKFQQTIALLLLFSQLFHITDQQFDLDSRNA